MQDRMYYSQWLNENLLNDYEKEEFVFVVHGREKFITNVNKFLEINEFNGYIIDCYDICEIRSSIDDVIKEANENNVGKLIVSGLMEEITKDSSLEEVFMENSSNE